MDVTEQTLKHKIRKSLLETCRWAIKNNTLWHDSPPPPLLHLLFLVLLSFICYPTSPPWRNHELTCAKHRGGRHCRMFVFTLQIYTIIFSTKFEPFELDHEQKTVWIMFYWLQCFVSIKANSMDTYHSHAALVFMKQGLQAGAGSQPESIVTLIQHTVSNILPNKNIKLGWFCKTLEYIYWPCFWYSVPTFLNNCLGKA